MKKFLTATAFAVLLISVGSVVSAQTAAVNFNGISGAGVLSDTVEIILDESKISSSVGLNAGEDLWIHPFYKYKQNIDDQGDLEITPCNWAGKCYKMNYSSGKYSIKINNIAEFFSLTGSNEWMGHRPVGFGCVFYNSDASKEVKADDNGDFWLSLKQDYKLDIYVHEQEEHRYPNGSYHYYAGDFMRLKLDRSIQYNTEWYLADDRQFPIEILSGNNSLVSLPTDAAFENGVYIKEFPLNSIGSQTITARTNATQNNRIAAQSFDIFVDAPIITLSHSATAVKEIEGENIDTIYASIPAITASNVVVSLNVAGSTHYQLSSSSITIPAGSTRAYVLLTALDDGVAGSRSPLIITAGAVQCADRTFTIEGSPLTLNVLNFPAVTFTGIINGENIVTGTQKTITATSGENCTWNLKINGDIVKTATGANSVTHTWNAAANGEYSISAEATNGEGNTTVKAINVKVMPLEEVPSPSITFITPLKDAVYPLGQTVKIEVAVQNADSVFFYSNGVLLQKGLAYVLTCDYTPAVTGNYVIDVVARNSALKQTAASRTIEVTAQPAVTLSLASIGGGSITVNAETNNADSLFMYIVNGGNEQLSFSAEAADMFTYTFSGLAIGVYGVKAVVKNAAGQSAFHTLSDISVTTLSNEALLSADVKVYPNPVKDVLYMEGYLGDYILVDIFGHVIKKGIVNSDCTTKIGVSDLKNGLYFLNFDSGQMNRKTVKIQVVR